MHQLVSEIEVSVSNEFNPPSRYDLIAKKTKKISAQKTNTEHDLPPKCSEMGLCSGILKIGGGEKRGMRNRPASRNSGLRQARSIFFRGPRTGLKFLTRGPPAIPRFSSPTERPICFLGGSFDCNKISSGVGLLKKKERFSSVSFLNHRKKSRSKFTKKIIIYLPHPIKYCHVRFHLSVHISICGALFSCRAPTDSFEFIRNYNKPRKNTLFDRV